MMLLLLKIMSCGLGFSSDKLVWWLTCSMLFSMFVSRFENLSKVIVFSSESESELKTTYINVRY